MRRLGNGIALVLVLAAGLVTGTSVAGGQVADNQIVVHAMFGNGTPGPDASVTWHVLCANQGGGSVETVVDETETMAAPWDPFTFHVPVLEPGHDSTFVGCEVTPQAKVFGFPMVGCSVRDAGTPPPDPSPPSGCGGLRVRADAFFPITVGGAIYDVTLQVLLPSTSPPAAVKAEPTFTG